MQVPETLFHLQDDERVVHRMPRAAQVRHAMPGKRPQNMRGGGPSRSIIVAHVGHSAQAEPLPATRQHRSEVLQRLVCISLARRGCHQQAASY